MEPGHDHLPKDGVDTSQGHYAVSVQVEDQLRENYRRKLGEEI